uniref:Uncharacterized protein n=1 Tax=Kalanchoe fedtschenkoi TaxID=63787 RepID=A0A7N0V5C8_KALFE
MATCLSPDTLDARRCSSSRPAREHSIPYLCESSDNDAMVIRCIQLQEAVQKLSQIIFRVYLILKNHLQH